MAGPYYVDIGDPGDWSTHTGLDTTTNLWRGISGLQKAFDSVTVGDGPVYIKGTGDLSKFYSVAYDADNDTTLIDGEVVNWDTGSWTDGSSGSGVVHITSTTATSPGTVEIELLTGTIVTEDAEIKGVTSGGIITPTAAIAQKTIDVNTNGGSNTGGFIKFIGVTDFTPTYGNRAIIDANSSAVDGLTFTTAADLLWFENMEVRECGGTTKHGWNWSTSYSSSFILINCCSHDNTGHGFYANTNYLTITTFWRCVAYNNTCSGFNVIDSSVRAIGCCAQGNTGNGFDIVTAINCISHGNTADGFQLNNTGVYVNCVSDTNAKGLDLTAHSALWEPTVIGVRITNNSTTGLDCGGDNLVLGFSYFEDNNGNNYDNETLLQNIPLENSATSSNDADKVDTNEGYAEAVANHNFATGYVDATDPTLRRMAITIPWT